MYRYVAVSKFDSRNKVPYSALAKVLSHILQQILSESEDDIRLFYDHLKISLGAQYSNIRLMAEFVPELNSLLKLEEEIEPKADNNGTGTGPSVDHKMDDMEARTRFHNLYIEIFRSITHWRMTTLVCVKLNIFLINYYDTSHIFVFLISYCVYVTLVFG